ncbi:MAG: RNA-binding protein [endosymbiont of Galathealinum brachiosum]|uniref:RNA-binding protein n=1 Tax=endosymbiont of Galathealinum brachiosum TaxID=2200906 RepID=A0A370DMD0_9GAMM|nr:MAG: RNA-binding protein [endosymbiont of Galathealinum brachiosum]
MELFELEGREYIELNNLLKITGLCESGGRAKILISEGQVKVDDQIELRKRCKIRKGQVVEFNAQQVQVS